ncbi:unnamed protein product [Spodoptera exigua]|nr:unnamed protein product [Spodoptera exigua]
MYLYDSEACGYKLRKAKLISNLQISNETYGLDVLPIRWQPAITTVSTRLSAKTRKEIQVWMSLHLLWMLFAVINMTQGQRSCSFYATLLPFTITGIALLITDVIYAILFLIDARYTYTESAILLYLTNNGHLRAIMKKPLAPAQDVEDTSWIAVSMAYCSMRGIVQWLLNFWIVKDNYFEGLEHYRSLEYIKPRMRRKSSSLNL